MSVDWLIAVYDKVMCLALSTIVKFFKALKVVSEWLFLTCYKICKKVRFIHRTLKRKLFTSLMALVNS